MITKSDIRSDHLITCGICRVEIEKANQIYQVGPTYNIVCGDCYTQFSKEDLEMMRDIFMVYGGYFGMIKGSKFSLLKILEDILTSTHGKGKMINTDQINIELMHKALLHGISPEQYITKLAFLMDD